MRKISGCLLLMCLFFFFQGHAQAKTRNVVTVTCSCDDPTGLAYAKALREALSSSKLYREASVKEGIDEDAIRINIVSLPLTEGPTGQARAALSIVCLHEGAIMHQFIETCTRIPIESCAKAMLADLVNWDTNNTAE